MPSEPNLTVAMVLAGAALALTGALRLVGWALLRMPRRVAMAALLAGLGVALGATALPSEPAEAPRFTLDPAEEPPSGHAAPRPSDGRIEGTVTDASGDPVADAVVSLRRFEGTEEVAEEQTRTSPDGTYRFGSLPVGPMVAHTVWTEHEGTRFSTDIIVLDAHASAQRADLTIAPPTEDPSVIAVGVDSTVVVGDEEGTQVVHILSVRNRSEEAFVAGLRLPVLPGAVGFIPREGLNRARLTFRDGEVASFEPVTPGEHRIVYEYTLPAPSGTLSAERPVSYPTERFELLVAGEIEVTEPGDLRDRGTVSLGATDAEREYRRWERTDLEAGDGITAGLALADDAALLRKGLIFAGVVGAVAMIGLPLVRRRRQDPAPPAVPATEEA